MSARPWLGYFQRWFGSPAQQESFTPIEVLQVGVDEPDDGALNLATIRQGAVAGDVSFVEIEATTRDLFIERMWSFTNAASDLRLVVSDPLGGAPFSPTLIARAEGSTRWSAGTVLGGLEVGAFLPTGLVELGRLLVPRERGLRVFTTAQNRALDVTFFFREA